MKMIKLSLNEEYNSGKGFAMIPIDNIAFIRSITKATQIFLKEVSQNGQTVIVNDSVDSIITMINNLGNNS